jgi:hypothetical protein
VATTGRGGHTRAVLWDAVPEGETPTPSVVAAWMVLDQLPAERVPMWAAEWLVQGYDGDALAEWAVNQVVSLVFLVGHADLAFEQPLGALWEVDDDLDEPWSRTKDELAEVVRQACGAVAAVTAYRGRGYNAMCRCAVTVWPSSRDSALRMASLSGSRYLPSLG